MYKCVFENDNNITILLPKSRLSEIFITRDKHEVIFRKIITYLLINKIITSNIIDLGAWIGDNSIPWSKNTKSLIYAIDPSPENCKFIEDICEINSINNVKVIQKCISDKNEILFTNDDLFHVTFITDKQKKTTGKNICQAYTLDYLYELKCIDNIGFIHLDVESMEFLVIIGGNKLIDTFRPIIAFEQHLLIDNFNELSAHIKNKNYTVKMINEILPGCREDCRNFIAFPNEIITSNFVENIEKYIGFNCFIDAN
jgi:FkbM family methyltransferase